MKQVNIFIFALMAFFPILTFADGVEIPAEARLSLNRKIERAVEKNLGLASLHNFSVDWDSLTCISANSGMEPDTDLGACILHGRAFQVASEVAIVKTRAGYRVTVIYADLE